MQNEYAVNSFSYYCEKCDYICSKKFLKSQHLNTKKHKMLINAHTDDTLSSTNKIEYTCKCGKVYKHIQSYNRHVKNCDKNKDKDSDLNVIISTLTEQYKNIVDENAEMRRIVTEMLPKVGTNNTTINNQFNIQMFLNNECKDAINLTDFIASLQLDHLDLNSTRENGYVAGISNILLRGLKSLELHKRPIHCSDVKREILYVKDDGVWEKENEDYRRIKGAITCVTKKQLSSIKEWEDNHKGWQNDERLSAEYCEIIQKITQPSKTQDENKIIKSIAREVIIRK